MREVALCIGDLLRSLAGGRGQLGPDQVPVFWAQGLTGNGAAGGAFDGNAVHRIWRSPTGAPIADNRLTDANSCGELSNPPSGFNCGFECVHDANHHSSD